MGTIPADQRFAVLASIGANIDWDSLTKEQVQVGIREGQRAGVEATFFIRNGFRVQVDDLFLDTGELSIPIPALPRLTIEEIQKKFSWVKSIERDTSPTEAVTLNFATILRPEENQVNGTEYERRITPKLDILLGLQQALWLVDHQDEFPAFMALLGKIYIDFSGLVVVRGDGNRGRFSLRQGGERWSVNWDWLGNDFDRHGRLALSGK